MLHDIAFAFAAGFAVGAVFTMIIGSWIVRK